MTKKKWYFLIAINETGITTGRHSGTPFANQCRPLYSSRGRVRPYRCLVLLADKSLIPPVLCSVSVCAGEVASVNETPLDFRDFHFIGERFRDVPGDVGYDTNYVLNTHPCHPDDDSLRKAAMCVITSE